MPISTGTDRPYRILSFDGGGVHAVSYLPVIHHLENHLEQSVAQSGQFDMVVGTSTGAIVAMALKLGCPAEDILDLYRQHARDIFGASKLSKMLSWMFYLYHPKNLRAILARFIRKKAGISHDLTWEEMSRQSPCPDLELVVTLWNVSKGQRSFLSTNLDRHPEAQAQELWQASVADIITTCCSAPYYFPARRFTLPGGETAVYCDGALTGLNNPSAFGVSLVVHELREQGKKADILSFGAGESLSRFSVLRFRYRTVAGILQGVIDSLLKSGGALMDRFYEVFGAALPIRKYLRTNHPRTGGLADWKSIPKLEQHFQKEQLRYRLFSNENEKIVNFPEEQATADALVAVWRDEFCLLPPTERGWLGQSRGVGWDQLAQRAPAHQPPLSSPCQGGAAAAGIGGPAAAEAALSHPTSDAPPQPPWPLPLSSAVAAPIFLWRWVLSLVPVFAVVLFIGLCVALGFAFSAWRGEKQQRGRAERERGEAEKQRDRADHLAKEEKKQRDRADGLLNVNRVSLADRELDVGNHGRAAEVLDECRWDEPRVERRGWEWRHLRRRAALRLTLKGHTGWVQSVSFSPDARRLASGSRDNTVKLWDAKTGTELLTLKGHTDHVNSVSFSPDGRRLASGSSDHTVKLWDAQIGTELLTLKGHTLPVTNVSFSPDGRRLASGSEDHTVKLWDAQTGTEVLTLKGHTASVWSVSFSPDGRRLASASEDHTVKLWDAQTGTELLTLNAHTASVWSVSFSPDGRRLASGSEDNTVKLWDAQTGTELFTLREHSGGVLSVNFSPDGRRLASGSRDNTVKLWDARSGMELLTLKGHSGNVWSVRFSADGRRLASGSEDNTVKLWDAQIGTELLTLKAHASVVTSVSFSPDGRRLASGSEDHTVKLWDPQTDAELLTLKGHAWAVQSVSFSPDGRRLASGSRDHTVKLWDAQTGTELLTLKGHTAPVLSVSFSPDGRRLASASEDHTVKLWDAQTGTELLTLKGHTASVWSVSFNPDGRLASGSWDNTVKLWDAHTGTALFTLKGHALRVLSARFSADGRRLASGSLDDTAKLWDAQTGTELLMLKAHTASVWSVNFSPDGRRLASGSRDHTVKLWDTQIGTELLTLKGHTHSVNTVSFSPDGRRLASGSSDHTVKLWDAQTGTELLPLKGHSHPVQSLGFSSDGLRIVARDETGITKAWRADTGEPVESFTDTAPAEPVREARSPDGKLHVWINGDELLARRIDKEEVERQERGEAEIAITWHLRSAIEAEKEQQWFAAAFHLGQLLKLAKETKDPGRNEADLLRRRAHALAELEGSSRALEAPPSKKKKPVPPRPEKGTASKE